MGGELARVTDAPISSPSGPHAIAFMALDAIDVDHDLRGDDAVAHIHHEVGTAPEQAAIAMFGARLDDILDRPRSHDGEIRQDFHQSRPARRASR